MAKKTGKRLTEAQKQKRRQQRNTERAYKRQRERIEKTITVETNMGGIVPPNILPPIPKKITEASVRRLKRITNISIISKTYYTVNRDYGEVVKGVKGRSQILKPVILPPNLYEHNPQLLSAKERFDEYKKQADKRLNYDLRKSTIDFESLDRKLDEQERREREEKELERQTRELEELDKKLDEQFIQQKAEDSYNENEIQKEIDKWKKEWEEEQEYQRLYAPDDEDDDYSWNPQDEIEPEESDILSEDLAQINEDEDREFQGRKIEPIEEPYIGQDSTDYDWEEEETEDERIRRKFEETLKRLNNEGEEEDKKTKEQEDYIERLKRLHDEEMKKRRKDGKKYSDNPASETTNVLENIEDKIARWEGKEGWSTDLRTRKEGQKNSLKEQLDSAIKRMGRDSVAKLLQQNGETVYDLIDDILYGYSSSINGFYNALNRNSGNLVTLSTILNSGIGEQERQALSEEMEEDETEEYEDE